MSLTRKNYIERLIDKRISEYIDVFGAISIEGPKWCGKTWTSLNHANSVTYLSDKNSRELAKSGLKNIMNVNRPQLIDEWQLAPNLWDEVRLECDMDHNKGKFILTGSTTLQKDDEEDVNHSGTGRFTILKMYPMSLYESRDSSGNISLIDMKNGNVNEKYLKEITLQEIATLVIRGGWPENINENIKNKSIIPKSYIDVVLEKDINERKDKKRDKNKMRMFMKSLARNESSIVSDNTILNDIFENENQQDILTSRTTLDDYHSVLEDLYLIKNQDAYSINYRSSLRVGKSPKIHFVDPSLSCALLNLNEEKLIGDLNTFGFMFESMVERDLRIYAEFLGGQLYHFRDNQSGDEVDAIIEFEDGEYAAFEIKLTANHKDEALSSLKKFYDNVSKKPKFMCAIIGNYQAITIDKDTGIYIIPITALKP